MGNISKDRLSQSGWPIEFVILMQHQRGWRLQGYTFEVTTCLGMNILLSPLALFILSHWPSIMALLNLSYALNLFILLSCIQLVHVLSVSTIRLKGLEIKGHVLHCFCDSHSTIVVCRIQRPVNSSKVEPNWVSSLGNLDLGLGRIHKIYSSHWQPCYMPK